MGGLIWAANDGRVFLMCKACKRCRWYEIVDVCRLCGGAEFSILPIWRQDDDLAKGADLHDADIYTGRQ